MADPIHLGPKDSPPSIKKGRTSAIPVKRVVINLPVTKIGNENSARSFSDRSFLKPPWGHGRPRLRVMDVRTEMLIFPGFRGPDRSFCPRTSARISAWASAGYPAPKLTLWAAFSFLTKSMPQSVVRSAADTEGLESPQDCHSNRHVYQTRAHTKGVVRQHASKKGS